MNNLRQLIQTNNCSIIYGTFNGEENQELFRCPRELDDTDLVRYINEYRYLVCPMNSKIPFINDDIADLRRIDGKTCIGYYRMYFRGGWYGRWFSESKENLDSIDKIGLNNICSWIFDTFHDGCDYYMKDYFENNFDKWGCDHRYLIKPYLSNYYKIMIDTTYGNEDYPVRIYVYHDKEDSACIN